MTSYTPPACGQLRPAQDARRVNGHRPASFPCDHGNQPGWWQLIIAYMSPRRPTAPRHRRCIMEQAADSSRHSNPSLAEQDQDEDKDRV
ncbi:hypothetical protein LSAT2_032733 [Lamellibrachia satsuma]|nr:hypothetical protein LSAT2_032733 [Lamellibrachia satsuma]